MIIDSIFNMFFSVINSLVNLMPTINPIKDTVNNNLISIINNVSCFMPVTTLYIALGIWLVLNNAHLTTSIVNWVIRKIPGVN